MVTGVLVVNKSSGMTSHDVVNSVRRLFNLRRVGHTGTLDPFATGVLVLLLGSATRLSPYMSNAEKSYRAVFRFGIETSTYDIEGAMTAIKPVNLELGAIKAVLADFQGTIPQIPPMYSAVKIDGQKLYDLARQGRTITRAPRDVTIAHTSIVSWFPPDLTLDIVCSAGTYVRSLAHDVGQKLGCGAHVLALTRTANHGFILAQSHTLKELDDLKKNKHLMDVVLPPSAALNPMPGVTLTPSQVTAVRYGQQVQLFTEESTPAVQAFDDRRNLIAILIPVKKEYWQPKVVLPPDIAQR